MKRRWVDLLVLLAFLYQQGACCCGSVASHAWVVVCAAAVSALAGAEASATESASEVGSCSARGCGCHDHAASHEPSAAQGARADVSSADVAGGCSDGCCGGHAPGGPLPGHVGHDPAHAHHLCLGFHLFALGLCPLALFLRPRRSWSEFWRSLVPPTFGGRFAVASLPSSCVAAAPRPLAPPSRADLQVFRF